MIIAPGWYVVWLRSSNDTHTVYISPSGSFHSLDGEVTHFGFYDMWYQNRVCQFIRDVDFATHETTD